MKYSVSACSDIGRKRKENQDCYYTNPETGLFVVADGMGGHAGGSVASQMAVELFVQNVEAQLNQLAKRPDTQSSREMISQILEDAVRSAGEGVYKKAQASTKMRGMGTTLSALFMHEGRGYIAHVGDSRVYLVRRKEVVQLTEDHSLINELIKQGKLRPGDKAKKRKYSNAITRAVGIYEDVKVDTFDFELSVGDVILICSDGLSQYLKSVDELGRLVGSVSFEGIAKTAVGMANQRGGSDNSTVVFIRLDEKPDQRDIGFQADLHERVDILSKMPMFQHLTYKELVSVLNICDVDTFEANEYVFKANELGGSMYIVLSGRISVQHDDVQLATLGPGGHFGEMAILDKSKRSATARAQRKTELLSIERRALFGLLKRDANVAVKILWCMTQILNRRLRSTNQALVKASQNTNDDVISSWTSVTLTDD
ncbi:MAG: Stp1/IreP family PP2C-type Ser/Thr phosphatase [Bradymonadia bacterium]